MSLNTMQSTWTVSRDIDFAVSLGVRVGVSGYNLHAADDELFKLGFLSGGVSISVPISFTAVQSGLATGVENSYRIHLAADRMSAEQFQGLGLDLAITIPSATFQVLCFNLAIGILQLPLIMHQVLRWIFEEQSTFPTLVPAICVIKKLGGSPMGVMATQGVFMVATAVSPPNPPGWDIAI